tara:strand:- start:3355 stop:3549 length:195 start_codon:yes stop_codon:yes gene_type:complete
VGILDIKERRKIMLNKNKMTALVKGWENGRNRARTIQHPYKLNKKVNIMGYLMIKGLNKEAYTK